VTGVVLGVVIGESDFAPIHFLVLVSHFKVPTGLVSFAGLHAAPLVGTTAVFVSVVIDFFEVDGDGFAVVTGVEGFADGDAVAFGVALGVAFGVAVGATGTSGIVGFTILIKPSLMSTCWRMPTV
jgi:hypothetical protein